MKKIVFCLCLLLMCLTLPCYAAKKSTEVEPIKNVAGEQATAAVKELQEQLIAALRESSIYTPVEKDDSSKPAYKLSCTITDVALYDPKSNREKVTALIRKGLGHENNPDGTPVPPEEREAAKQELKDISASTNGVKLVVEARLFDASANHNVLTKNFTSDKVGTSSEKAVYNVCQNMAKNILQAMETAAVPEEAPSDTPKSETPEEAQQPVAAESKGNFRGIIGDIGGDNLYIDQGSASGLKVGEVLEVFRISGDVTINGKVVGKKELKIGKAKVVEVLSEYAVCVVLSRTEDIKVNDVVKRLVK
ncbi:hypothetical protein [Selenomonas ruminantium]|uniref:hypothetical protein n=1 Tax=Selenomonas ruminantium TaxID=971 RepID=UPI0009322E5C|nr:hypothetical protein [Selenomonas ruminantium]